MADSGRRLAAILFTDMVGYSSLAQRSESLALRLVGESERIIRSLVTRHGGREVKSLGDGFLIEFGSALNATECAIEIQRAIRDYNARPGTVAIDLRIGVHVGDVEYRDGDIVGDAVNIASRVEGLAEPGGVCITGAVLDQVQNKVPYRCQELERVSLKNISRPVSVSRIVLPWVETGESGLTPWTGRERELQAVVRAINAVRRREGRVLFIRGEAGIGKTRLVQEALRQTSGAGLRVLRGRALPGEPCPPYGYWVEAAREFFHEATAETSLKVCSEGAGEIVKLLPELANRLGFGEVPSLTGLDPGQERLRFYDSITRLFLNIAQEMPLVLFLDDIQWADTSSLRLLQFTGGHLGRSPLLLLATFRDDDPQANPTLREVVDDLTRHHVATALPLTRLSVEDVRSIVEFIVGTNRSNPELSTRLFQRTGGNPFFVEETLLSLVESGAIGRYASGAGPSNGDLPLPENVRHVIRLRLGRLNPSTVEALRVASVIGTEFSFDVLRQATGSNEDALLAAIEEALQVRVLRERRAERGEPLYSFADDQIRDTLYGEVSLARAQRHHRRIGEVLELSGAAGRPGDPEVIANHFLLGNDPERALKYVVQSGDTAAGLYAPEQAVGRYGTALELLKDGTQEALRCEVLERQGEQLQKLGEVEAQVLAWEQAIEGQTRLGNDRRAGDLLRRLGTLRAREGRNPEEGRRSLARAQELLEREAASPELARLYLDLSDLDEAEGKASEAAVSLVKALGVADRLNDPAIKAEIRVRRGVSPLHREVGAFREELLQHLEYGLHHDPGIALQVYWQLASVSALGGGDFLEAREWVRKGIAFAEKTRDLHWAMVLKGVGLGFLSIALGDVDLAARSLQEHHDFLETHHQPPDGRTLRLLGEVAMIHGDFDTADALFDRAAEAGSPYQAWLSDILLILDRARLDQARGALASAFARLEKAMPSVRTASVKSLSWFLEIWFLALLVEISIAEGETARTAPYLKELQMAVRDLDTPAARGFLYRAEGQLAAASGDFADAEEKLRRSIAEWEASGWAVDRARTEVGLAEIYRRSGRRDLVRELAGKAAQFFRGLSAGPDLERAISVMNREESS